MNTLAFVALVVLVLALAVVVAALAHGKVRASEDWTEGLTRELVVVHMDTGGSMRGVLIGVYSDALVLAHAEMLTDSSPVTVDGDATIPRTNVSWIQRPKAGE